MKQWKIYHITTPYMINDVTFTTPIPLIKTNMISFIEPFHQIVWILLFVNIFLIILLELIFIKNNCNIFWSIICIIFRQQDIIKCKIRRLLLLGWLLSGIVLTSSYCGCIYSHMTKPRYCWSH